MGSAVLAMSFVIAWRLPRPPGPLIAMILAGGCVALFDLASNGIQTVGAVSRGLVVPTLPSLTGVDIVSLLPTALGGCHVPGQHRDATVDGRTLRTPKLDVSIVMSRTPLAWVEKTRIGRHTTTGIGRRRLIARHRGRCRCSPVKGRPDRGAVKTGGASGTQHARGTSQRAQGLVTLSSEDRDCTCRSATVWDALFGCVWAARVQAESAHRRPVTRERMVVPWHGSND